MQKELMEKFVEVYGEGGEIREYFAPGRVNLIGEHTDYNGGHVFPCALTLGTYGLARKRDDRKLRFYSVNFSRLGVIESPLIRQDGETIRRALCGRLKKETSSWSMVWIS